VRDFFDNYIAKLPVAAREKILNTSYSRKKKFQ
jgi:hypothetical protein